MASTDSIVQNKPDPSGNMVLCIYARNSQIYVVYRDPMRVVVHFADDTDIAAKQRAALSLLAPLRGQISGLIDGWRTPDDKQYAWYEWFQKLQDRRNRPRAKRYDRRVADALIMGLEGSIPAAVCLLTDIRNDIISVRKAIAQGDYMLWTAMAGILFIFAVWLLSNSRLHLLPQPPEKVHLILTGAAAGTLGAYFSIAIGLRNRTVLIDLQKWDNRNDGLLRIAVGTIGAGILLCLLLAQWVTLSGVTETLTGKKGEDLALLMALSIGFVAGFSERAVGDLLGKAGDSLTDAAPSKDVAVEQAKAAAAAATQAPVTGPPDSDVTAAAPADPAGDVLDESPCDSPPVDGETWTADEDLPVAVGGVSADVPAPSGPAAPDPNT